MSNYTLVQRLRSGRHNIEDETIGGVVHDRRCLEAADEIERLRNQIATFRTVMAKLLMGLPKFGPDEHMAQKKE